MEMIHQNHIVWNPHTSTEEFHVQYHIPNPRMMLFFCPECLVTLALSSTGSTNLNTIHLTHNEKNFLLKVNAFLPFYKGEQLF